MFVTILKNSKVNSKVKLRGEENGIDANGDTVYVRVMELDQKFGVFNNKKIAIIQTEIIKEARKNLEKQKGSTVF